MIQVRAVIILLSAAALLLAFRAVLADNKAGFLDRKISIGASDYRYKVFIPADRNPRTKGPIILFLHGAGERGDDNEAQTRVGVGPALLKQPADFPAVVVFPQCPRNRWWNEPEMEAMALNILDAAVTEFNGDSSRIYLTGLSMGGYGTWAIARSTARKFAGMGVICGGVKPPPGVRLPAGTDGDSSVDPYRAIAEKVKDTPVWVFHGGADPVVPVTESRKMVEAIKAVGGDVRYTEYEGVGHNSWDRAYAEPAFFSWLLSNRLAVRPNTQKKKK